MRITHRMDYDDESVEMSNDAVTWPEQLSFFKRFLYACGYFLPPGELDIIEDDYETHSSYDEPDDERR